MKVAAAEALYEDTGNSAPFSVLATIDQKQQKAEHYIEVPSMLSFLAYDKFEGSLKGMKSLQKEMDEKYKNDPRFTENGRFLSYVYNKKGPIKVETPSGMHDSSQNKWYTVPMNEKRIYVIPPYMYEDVIMMTIAMPIMDGDKPIGVVSADIEVTSLQAQLEESIGKSDDKYVVLAADDKNIVANSQNADTRMTGIYDLFPNDKELIDNAFSGKEVIENVRDKSNKRYNMILVPVQIGQLDIKWVYAQLNSMSSFTAHANFDMKKEIIVGIIFAIILVFLISVINNKPLEISTFDISNPAIL